MGGGQYLSTFQIGIYAKMYQRGKGLLGPCGENRKVLMVPFETLQGVRSWPWVVWVEIERYFSKLFWTNKGEKVIDFPKFPSP